MQVEHQAMDSLLVQDTRVLSKTVLMVVVEVQLPMVAMQPVTHSLVLAALVVIFLHGLVNLQPQPIKVAVAVALLSGVLTGATHNLELRRVVLVEAVSAVTKETVQTVQQIAVAVRVQAAVDRVILLTQELDELVDRELSMCDTQQVDPQTPIQLAPAIHLYNIAELVNHFDFKTTLSSYKYHRGVILDVKDKNRSYSRVTGITSLSKATSDTPENDQLLKQALSNVVNTLVQNYAKTYDINDLNPLHDWLLMEYLKGDYFKVHKDDLPDVIRTVSVVVYLNDSYKGGEIEFPDFGILFKPAVWDVLVFPSSFAYRHGVHPISDGVRYSAVNWYTHSNQQ
jgi:hypothetical protein